MGRRLKDYLPKGLYWRSFLIIVLPVALMQLVIAAVFLDAHWRATSKRMSQLVAGDVALLAQLYNDAPGPAQLDRVARLGQETLGLGVRLEPGAALEAQACRPSLSLVDRYFRSFLADALGQPVWYDGSCPGQFARIRAPVTGGVLEVLARKDRVQAASGLPFLLWLAAASLALLTVSILFIRNQVRPIERLADAMDAFGRGAAIPEEFRPRGAREVRRAAAAFLSMRERIARHIEQRSMILAGVSHDLRTPITRLKLQLALLEDGEAEAAKSDLADMEATLDEYLAFARGQLGEAAQTVDLSALAREAAAGAGAAVEVRADGPLEAPGRPNALRRCLANLIDNAAAHGDRVVVTARRARDGCLEIVVEDDGPGIPDSDHEEAFRPFSRLDETRSRNAKGVGLGLAIARDAARAHGGDILLSRSDLGGLKATVRLPGPSPVQDALAPL